MSTSRIFWAGSGEGGKTWIENYPADFIRKTVFGFGNAMKLGKLGTQVVLKSKKSFDAIRFIGVEACKSPWMFRRRFDGNRLINQAVFFASKSHKK